jgi:dipeptidyl aminopeptidase/acylaminoacyl peptidase
MADDIRHSDAYKRALELHQILRRPGEGLISDARELAISPDGKEAAFSGAILAELDGPVETRICVTNLESGETRVISFGPNCDRSPKYSPDGRWLAFLSDRAARGDFQLQLIDLEVPSLKTLPLADAWAEYIHWSPDGAKILIGAAPSGADLAAVEGAIANRKERHRSDAWFPEVEASDSQTPVRSLWIADPGTGGVQRLETGFNPWEACWAGPQAIAAIASDGADESEWYNAGVRLLCCRDGASKDLYRPGDQIGGIAASPDGHTVAVIEAVASDRGVVVGELLLIDVERSIIDRPELPMDVGHAEWRSEGKLLLAGHQGAASIAGDLTPTGEFKELWRSEQRTSAGAAFQVSALPQSNGVAMLAEGFTKGAHLVTVEDGIERTIRSFDLGYEAATEGTIVEQLQWASTDGTPVHGFLLKPRGEGPFPLITHVHGGPVWAWRSLRQSPHVLMLLKKGFAFFLPNPRGSTNYGQDFIRAVYGDMGGGDADDILSGIDHLTEGGIADRGRLGVMGGSYGGFMTAWLVARNPRFAAAVTIAPHTNQITTRLLGNIGRFMDQIIDSDYRDSGGQYWLKSPVFHIRNTSTPVLNIAGALDRCTPPGEAIQFHRALREAGAASELVIYPQEGHGVRSYPAVIDFNARIAAWFEQHLENGQSKASND